MNEWLNLWTSAQPRTRKKSPYKTITVLLGSFTWKKKLAKLTNVAEVYKIKLVFRILAITNHLKLVTQTERIPASAAARHATGTTSETCFSFNKIKYHPNGNISLVIYQNDNKRKKQLSTTRSALIEFSQSTSVVKMDALGATAVSEY